MKKIYSPHIQLAHELWQKHLEKEDIAIDATCGNGHDTRLLSTLCFTIGLDIQPQAIVNTQAIAPKATLYLLSHEHIDTLVLSKPPRLIVYNLGYLPRSDKSITTLTETTLVSVEKSLSILAPKGALSITCYPGHPEGEREQKRLEEWLTSHPNAIHHKWGEKAPSLIWLTKL